MFFLMSLALRLGKTLSEIMSSITASELKMWIEYDRLSPIGDQRSDIQAALIASTTAQSQGCKVSISDFMVNWGGSEEGVEANSGSSGIEAFFDKLAD